MNKPKTMLGRLGAALTTLFVGVGASAEESPRRASENVIEEIVVTAQKTSQAIQDVAGSITAFGEQQLESRGIQSVEELYQSVPGLSFSSYLGTNIITIRGIGLQVETGVGEPGVATHINGVYQPRTTMGSLDLHDLERAEILRGPQGTLYGRNSTGGVVNFITKAPSDVFEGQFKFGTGSWDKILASGFVSGPISDNLLGRLSAAYTDHNGYVDNLIPEGESTIGDERHESIRFALRFMPTDSLTIDLSASWQEQEYDLYNQHILLSEGSDLASIPGLEYLIPTSEAPHTVAIRPPYPQGEKETTSGTLNIEWNINDATTFRSISGYIDHQKGPDLPNAVGATAIAQGTPGNEWVAPSHNFSQEFNLSGTSLDDKLSWVVGAYYFEEDYSMFLPPRFLNGLDAALGASVAGDGVLFVGFDQSFSEQTESYALFADLTYSITESFRVNVGLRQSWDEKEISQSRAFVFTNPTGSDSGFVPANSTVRNVLCNGDLAGSAGESGRSGADEKSTLPKIRFEWDANDDLLVYALWQKGFKSGSTNIVDCDDTFDPETVIAYELGFKSTLLEGSVVINGAIYHYDYENLQILTQEGVSALVENINESEIKGVEVEILWQASDILSLDGTVAYSDAEIIESKPTIDSVAQLRGIVGIDGIIGNRLSDGNPVPRTPELTASLGVNLRFDTEAGAIEARGELYYSDEIQYRLFDNEVDVGDSYTVGNIYVTYTPPSERFGVRAFLRNFTDKDYIHQLNHSAIGGHAVVYAPGRHWGLEASYNF